MREWLWFLKKVPLSERLDEHFCHHRWGMVEPEEMDEDEEDLSGVAKVHAKIFENYTLHVGNIDLTEASEVALNALFSRFGHVVQVTVRVRKEPELSWALITMLVNDYGWGGGYGIVVFIYE